MNRQFYYTLGRPFSPLYGWLMQLREKLYQKNILASYSFPVPVISIGNLTMGGTGKTPMVQYLARLLQGEGYQPAIISRGYGGATTERINIVSDGQNLLLEADYVGDEPRMLAETLPGVFVLTGIVRKLPAAKAVEMGANILLLDDGFQHFPLRRDLDLILFNADTLAGNSRVFPGGDLREPVRALNRCHAFVLTGADEKNREQAIPFAALLQEKFPKKPVFFSTYCSTQILCQENGQRRIQVTHKELAARKCFAFCGIARPDGFQQTLNDNLITPVRFKALPDHHAYSKKIVTQLLAEATDSGADALLVTEKDLAKLNSFKIELPIYTLVMEVIPDLKLNRLVLDCAEKKK